MPIIAIASEGESVAIDTFAEGSVGSVDTFRSELEKLNVTVQEGKVVLMDILKHYGEGKFPSCYYSNPCTLYIVYQLPDAPGQKWSSEFNGPDGLSPEYLLAPDEAIIFIGKKQPNQKRFAFLFLGLVH